MLSDIIRALSNGAGVDEFVVSEKKSITSRRSLVPHSKESTHKYNELKAILYSDTRLGRGQSQLSLSPNLNVDSEIQSAVGRARKALGPTWRLQAPAAPARVRLNTKNLLQDTEELVAQISAEISANRPKTLQLLEADVTLRHEQTRAILSNGFDNRKESALLDIRLTSKATKGRPIQYRVSTRSWPVDWDALFEREARLSEELESATSPSPGDCDLVLLGDCYFPGQNEDFGIWSALAHQCSAELARRGLARYRVGQSLRGDEFKGESLSLSSDGTTDYGLRTAPFGDFGQAVRQFPIIDDMRAAGLSMGYRDASLSSGTSNGGVRNLVIQGGLKPLEELLQPTGRPLLVVNRLSEIRGNSRGPLSLQITSGEWRATNAAGTLDRSAIGSCAVAGNIYQWLQDAYYSREIADYHWYHGPKAIRFNKLRVL